MDPSLLTVLVLLTVLYFVERNIFIGFWLLIVSLRHEIYSTAFQAQLRVRLWFDRRSFKRDLLGKAINEYQLWRIRNNPMYKEFFRYEDKS